MKPSYGKLLISFVAVVTAVVPYLADWNDTHIYNETWSPHAKYHVGHTMVIGTVLGLLSLHCLWRRTGDPADNLRFGALVAAVYWVAQAGAVLVPGTAMTDPEFVDRIPTVAGIQPNQIFVDLILLALIAIGYRWQRNAGSVRTRRTELVGLRRRRRVVARAVEIPEPGRCQRWQVRVERPQ